MKYYEVFDAIAKALTKSNASNNADGGQNVVGGVDASEVQKMIEKALSENQTTPQVIDKELIESEISKKLATLNVIDFEIIQVPSDLFLIDNGYPFTVKEVPFGKTYATLPLVIPVQQYFNPVTSSWALQVYAVTNTGFKMRINTKKITPLDTSSADRVSVYALVVPQNNYVQN